MKEVNVEFSEIKIPVQVSDSILLQTEVTSHITIEREFIRRIGLEFHVSPHIDCTVQYGPDIHITPVFDQVIHILYPLFLHIEVQFEQAIHIDQNFELTDNEIAFMYGLVGSPKESRMQAIQKLYFGVSLPVRQIATHLNLSVSQVYSDINECKQNIIKGIKKDLRSNKKILAHMCELVEGLGYQIQITWRNYEDLEANAEVSRAILRTAREQARTNVEITGMSVVTDNMKLSLSIHDRKQQYLDLLRRQTLAVLQVWDRFGLTGEDAIKLIMSGGIDLDTKIKQVKTTMVKMLHIISEEVKDDKAQKLIFGRVRKEIIADELRITENS